MREKQDGRARLIVVLAGAACVLALFGVGVSFWHPRDAASTDAGADGLAPAGDDAPAGDAQEAEGGATLEEAATYTDGGSGTREEREQFASLDPQIAYYDDMNEVLLASQDASIHANKAFVFLGTVLESEDLSIERNRYEIPTKLRVKVDRVYSGSTFSEDGTVALFFPVSRYVDDMGRAVQAGPRMEAGRSYVFFCDLPEDALVKSWLDDRYPGSPGLADGFDLVVSWDAYCFPVKDGLVCAWTANGWSGGGVQSVDMPYLKRKDFAEDLFYKTGEGEPETPDGLLFDVEDFALSIEAARDRGPSDEIGFQRIMIYSMNEL